MLYLKDVKGRIHEVEGHPVDLIVYNPYLSNWRDVRLKMTTGYVPIITVTTDTIEAIKDVIERYKV